MAYQIAFVWSKDCEKELLEKGFIKEVVYIKSAPSGNNSKESIEKGDAEFFGMDHKPKQFVTTVILGSGS